MGDGRRRLRSTSMLGCAWLCGRVSWLCTLWVGVVVMIKPLVSGKTTKQPA